MNARTLKYELVRVIRRSSTLDYNEALELMRQLFPGLSQAINRAEVGKALEEQRQKALEKALEERNAKEVQGKEATS